MMDIFSRRALVERDAEIKGLREEIDIHKAEIAKLEAKLRGDRVCDGCCAICKHGFPIPTFFPAPMVSVTAYACDLDCKCKDFERIGGVFNTLDKDAEIARLSDELDEARRQLETRRKCSVTLTPGNERQDLLTALGQLSEGAKAIETEQSLIDALLFDRAAAALRSDPYEECFTQEFQETHFLDAHLEPKTNGGRVHAMSDNDLAAFLQNPPPLAVGQSWRDWMGADAQ